MNEKRGWIIILDDDTAVLTAMRRLLECHGFEVLVFESAGRLINSGTAWPCPACLVLDVHLPDINGFDLERTMRSKNRLIPIIFITGYGSIPMSVQAMKNGAVDFLSKPIDESMLLQAVTEGLRRDRNARAAADEMACIKARIERLTPREAQVLPYIISGLLNKQIAFALDISEKTVKVHRARIMAKMAAYSIADLVRQCDSADIAPVSPIDSYR